MYKKIVLGIGLCALLVAGGYLFLSREMSPKTPAQDLDPAPQYVVLSGTYVCLPHLDTTGPQTEECAFGLKTDDGIYYAVNFGQSGSAMNQFQSGAHIKAEGFVVIKEALSSSQWDQYNMKGIFTVLKLIEPDPAA